MSRFELNFILVVWIIVAHSRTSENSFGCARQCLICFRSLGRHVHRLGRRFLHLQPHPGSLLSSPIGFVCPVLRDKQLNCRHESHAPYTSYAASTTFTFALSTLVLKCFSVLGFGSRQHMTRILKSTQKANRANHSPNCTSCTMLYKRKLINQAIPAKHPQVKSI